MDRGPRWTLRLAALFLGSAPMMHHLLSPVRWARFEPFSNLRVIETMFERAPIAWLLCWMLPFAASFPSWRSEAWTSGFTFMAHLGLLVSLMGSRDSGALALALAAGVAFVAMLILARVEVEVAAAWSRIWLAGILVAACVLEFLRHPAWSAGLQGLALGSLLMAAGEIWALRSVPVEERPED